MSRDTSVRELDASADPRWDAYVADHPEGVVFHRSTWLRVLQREYGQQPLALGLEGRDGRLRGILPLMRTRGLPLGLGGRSSGGERVSSLPRTPIAGPLGDDPACAAALVRAALERVPDGAQLQLKLSEPSLEAIAEIQGHPWRLNFTVELPDDPDEIRFGTASKHKRVVSLCRRALEHGLTVREAESPADVRAWYRLYLETMRHHVVPPRGWRVFAAMWAELRPHGMLQLLLAEHGGRLIGGNLLVTDGKTAFYLFNGARRDSLGLGTNDLLQYDAIHRLCATGHRCYDLGEVVEGHEGLARFKRKWGADERRLHRYYAPAPASPPDPGDAEQGVILELGHRLWRHLPLRATAAIGTALYRYL